MIWNSGQPRAEWPPRKSETYASCFGLVIEMNDEIRVDVSSLELYRRNHGWVFADGENRSATLMSLVVREIFSTGGRDASILEHDGNCFVSSNMDWLNANHNDVNLLFEEIRSIPEVGVNGIGSALLIRAYSEHITTFLHGDPKIIIGSQIMPPFDAKAFVRVLAFRLSNRE